MVAEAEIVCGQRIPVLNVKYRCKNLQEIDEIVTVAPSSVSPPNFDAIRGLDSVSTGSELVSCSFRSVFEVD